MNKKQETYTHCYLKPFEAKPFWVRLSYLYVKQHPWPAWFSYTLELISYLQLIALMFHMHFSLYPPEDNFIMTIMDLFTKILDPVKALDFTTPNFAAVAFFIATEVYNYALSVLFAFTVYLAYKKREGDDFACQAWASIIQMHSMVLYYPLVSCGIKIIFEKNFNLSNVHGLNIYFIGTGYWMLIVAIFFAILGGCVTYNIMPTKEITASANKMEHFTIIVQKSIIQLLLAASSMTTALQWVLVILNLVISVLRKCHLKITLPIYNLNFLNFASKMASVAYLLSFSIFINLIIWQVDNANSIYIALIAWMIPLPLFLKYDAVAVNNLIQSLIFTNYKDLRTWRMAHKIGLLKHVTEYRKEPHQHTKQINKEYFFYSVIMNNLEYVFDTSLQHSPNCSPKDAHNRIILGFLERAVRCSTCYYMKLYLAYWHIKKMKHNARGLILLNELDDNSVPTSVRIAIIYLQNLCFKDIQKKDKDQVFSLSLYLKNFNLKSELKDGMKKQLKDQLEFWKEYNERSPNIVKLKCIEKSIYRTRTKIMRTWNRHNQEFHGSFTYPYFLYSAYLAVLNNNPVEGEKFASKALAATKRFHNSGMTEELTNENAYNDESIVITISGSLRTLGVIQDCTHSIDMYGYDSNVLVGSNVNNLMSPFFRESHNSYIMKYLRSGKGKNIGTHAFNFMQKRNGSIAFVSQHVRIDPSICDGLKFIAVIRPIKTTKQFILIRDNDKVEAFTEEIGKMLGLEVNMKSITICAELATINQAFNFIARKKIETTQEEEFMMKLCQENVSQDLSPGTPNMSSYRSLLHDNSTYMNSHREESTLRFKRDESEYKFAVCALKPHLSQDENVSTSIYEHYTQEGGELTYFNYKDIKSRNAEMKEFVGETHMHVRIYGDKFIKVLTIDNIYQVEDESEGKSISVKRVEENSMTKAKPASSLDSLGEKPVSFNGFDGSFRVESNTVEVEIPDERDLTIVSSNYDEKKTDRMPHFDFSYEDPPPLSTNRLQPLIDPTVPKISLNGVGVSLTQFEVSGRDAQKTTTRIIIEKRKESTTDKHNAKSKETLGDIKKFQIINRRAKAGAINESSSVGGSGSSQRKLEVGINEAIEVQVYPHFYKIFIGIIFLTFLVAACLIWTLRIKSSNTLNDYGQNADTVFYANNRLQTLLYLNRWERFLYNIILNRADMTQILNRWPTAPDIITNMISDQNLLLSDLNKQLKEAISTLRYRREDFFVQDTKLYEADGDGVILNQYTLYDSFHAIDRIVEKTLDITANSDQGVLIVPQLEFSLYNSMNEVIIVSVEDESRVLQSTLDARNSNFALQDAFLWTVVALLILNFGAIIWQIYYRYKHETLIYGFLVGIQPLIISSVQKSIHDFEAILDDEKLIYRTKLFDTNYLENNTKNNSGRMQAKNPNFNKFLIQIVKKSALLFIIIIFLAVDVSDEYSTTRNDVNQLGDSFNRLSMATRLQFYVDLSTAGIVDLCAENATTTIQNQPVFTEMEVIYYNILNYTHDFTETIRDNSTSEKEAYIYKLMLKDPCPELKDDANSYDICYREANDVRNTGLVGIINKFTNALVELFEDFLASPKTAADLRDLAAKATLMPVALDEVIRATLRILSQFLRDELMKEKDAIVRSKNQYNAASIVLNIVGFFLIYWFGIRKLIEGENRFKRIFKLLPKQVLLDNKVLRNYLIRNSKDALNAYKHFM